MSPPFRGLGLLLILSAPSGAGKTTLARRLLAAEPSALFSVSYTTRAPRGQERDGVDYCFVDEPAFRAMIAGGDFLEWASVHGHLYGTHRETVEAARQGKLVVLDIDVQGGNTIQRKHPEAVSVFILPPSMAELEHRLRGRKTDADDAIRKRLEAARAEIERGLATYDYVVVNDTVDGALQDLRAIVRAERCRSGHVDLAGFGLVPDTAKEVAET